MTENNFDHRGEYDRAVRIANALRLLLLVLNNFRDTGTLQAAVQVSRTVRDLVNDGTLGRGNFKPWGVTRSGGHWNPISYVKELRENPEALREQIEFFSTWSLDLDGALRHFRLRAEAAAYLDERFVADEGFSLNDPRYRWAIEIASDAWLADRVRI